MPGPTPEEIAADPFVGLGLDPDPPTERHGARHQVREMREGLNQDATSRAADKIMPRRSGKKES